MSGIEWVLAVACGLCGLSLVMILRNLSLYTRAEPAQTETASSRDEAADTPLVTVCIPARNEERNIEACVRSVLAGSTARVEVLVYDDQSDDSTPAILERLTRADDRIRRAATRSLPPGWNGKQHACWRMAEQARGRWLLFTDADVRFAPGAAERSVAEAERRGVGLLSTFPRQELGTLAERLMVPMIFFILFSYLPFGRMRNTLDPSASAGCGQFLLVERSAYSASGGHDAFRNSMHDGIKLPRAVRRAGIRTDLFDGSDLVACRMYHGLSSAWRGFAKNAYEGLGNIAVLLFFTVIHTAGHLFPAAILVAGLLGVSGVIEPVVGSRALALAASAVALAITGRLLLCRRFGQPASIAFWHPAAVVMMTAVQWHSFLLDVTGKRSWRGRTATEAPAAAGV